MPRLQRIVEISAGHAVAPHGGVLVRALLAGSCALVLACVLAPLALAETLSFRPVADGFTRSDAPDQNYGSWPRISTERDNDSRIRKAYLRFEVQLPADATVQSATLMLFSRSIGSDRGVRVKSVQDNGWGEDTLTWSNAPPYESGSVSVAAGYDDFTWVSFDVSPMVTGSGPVSFALSTPEPDWHGFRSRENLDTPPRLVIETAAAPDPTPPPDPDPTPPPDPGPLPTTGPDPVIAAAGDISCPGICGQGETAALIALMQPRAVIGLGDYQYDYGTLEALARYYDPFWGAFKPSTYAINGGSHDFYGTGDYLAYFNDGGPVLLDAEASYSFDLGEWHFVALNSYCFQRSSCDEAFWTEWLRNDLQTSSRRCTLAYFHEPYWTTPSSHQRDTSLRPWMDLLYDYGADVVLQAHNHVYERFAPQTPADQADEARGIVSFTVGTGGRSHYGFSGDPAPNSLVRDAKTYGVLKMVLHAESYDFDFIPVPGATFRDSGSRGCH